MKIYVCLVVSIEIHRLLRNKQPKTENQKPKTKNKNPNFFFIVDFFFWSNEIEDFFVMQGSNKNVVNVNVTLEFSFESGSNSKLKFKQLFYVLE